MARVMYITYTSLFLSYKIMKQTSLLTVLLAVSLLSGCELVGDIFKAGAYTAIIGIVIVVALVLWLLSKFRSRS